MKHPYTTGKPDASVFTGDIAGKDPAAINDNHGAVADRERRDVLDAINGDGPVVSHGLLRWLLLDRSTASAASCFSRCRSRAACTASHGQGRTGKMPSASNLSQSGAKGHQSLAVGCRS